MSYNGYGLVISDQLIQQEPPFRKILKEMEKCDQLELPASLRPYIGRRLKTVRFQNRNLFYKLFAVERLRLEQRLSAEGIPSVIVFACQIHGADTLQATLLPYVLCATALIFLPQTRMIICNQNANHDALSTLARERGIEHPLPLDRITCLPNIHNFTNLMNVLTKLSQDERLSLLYLSSHGNEEGLFGQWTDKGGPQTMSPEQMQVLGDYLMAKRSSDAQVFLNSCLSARTAAPSLANMVPGTIVMGSTESIPTGTIHHHFAVDALSQRLYATFNSVNLAECEVKAFYQSPPEVIDLTF